MKTLKTIAVSLFCLAAVCIIGLITLDFKESNLIDNSAKTYDLYQAINTTTNENEHILIDSTDNVKQGELIPIDNVSAIKEDISDPLETHFVRVGREIAKVKALPNGIITDIKAYDYLLNVEL